jgi:hypothetical protein
MEKQENIQDSTIMKSLDKLIKSLQTQKNTQNSIYFF